MDLPPGRPGAVLLDMDGVLIDSEPIYRSIVREAVAAAGGQLTDALYASLLGLPEAGVVAGLGARLGSGFDPDRYRETRRALLDTTFAQGPIPAKRHAGALLRELNKAGIAHAVATSTPRPRALRSLELSGLAGLVGPVVCGDDVVNGKPAPDIYLEAAARVGCPPPRCVVVEDSEAGIVAAGRAGMRAIFVPDLAAPSSVVRRSAVAIVDSLAAVAQFVLEDVNARDQN